MAPAEEEKMEEDQGANFYAFVYFLDINSASVLKLLM